MFVLILIVVLIILFILFKRNYNQYASGLRSRPSYLLWLITRFIDLQGWSKEEYCLRTDAFKYTDQSGYLSEKDIPLRPYSRPKMLRGVPHRQLTQQAPDDIMNEMYKYIESITIPRYGGETLKNDLLLYGESVVEYTGAKAIFLANASRKSFEKGEFAHIHSNDGSFHMILHPADAKLLIDKQWAEKFPLVGKNIFNKVTVPEAYLLVYAPQNDNELKIWKSILHASIDYNQKNQKKR